MLTFEEFRGKMLDELLDFWGQLRAGPISAEEFIDLTAQKIYKQYLEGFSDASALNIIKYDPVQLEVDAKSHNAKIAPEEPVPDVDPTTANLRRVMLGLDYIKLGFGLTTMEMLELSGVVFDFVLEHYPEKTKNIES